MSSPPRPVFDRASPADVMAARQEVEDAHILWLYETHRSLVRNALVEFLLQRRGLTAIPFLAAD